jgi:hypothetical protein
MESNDGLRLPPPWITPATGLPSREVRPVIIVQRRKASATYDTDAQTYITAVEAADGQGLETATRDAINTLVLALKANSLWTNAAQLLLPCGPRTLSGALVPLKGAAPTNGTGSAGSSQFVSGDYNRKTGLGDASNTGKFLNSNVLQNSLPATSHALVWHGSVTESSGDRILIGHFNDVTLNRFALLILDAWTPYVPPCRAFRSLISDSPANFPNITSSAAASCLIGSRTASNAAALYVDGTAATSSFDVSGLFEARSIYYFGLRVASTTAVAAPTGSKLQCGGLYSSGLNATQAAALRSAFATYVAAIAAAF